MIKPWIEWNGGKRPVRKGVLVDVLHRDGDQFYGIPAGYESAQDWSIDEDPDWHSGGDIMAYRISGMEIIYEVERNFLEDFGD